MNVMNEIRGCRPFPVDKDRQERCRKVLESCGMTITELALHLGVSRVYISNILSGRNLTPAGETKIANFFGVPREALFPLRTAEEIYRHFGDAMIAQNRYIYAKHSTTST